jgi:hypothetical protein
MTKKELIKLLEKDNIPKNSYSLDGGLPNDRLCLDKAYSGWVVYYTEMGEKYEEIGFASEEDACEYFYRRIREMTGRK